MGTKLLLEERRELLMNRLSESLQKKRVLELRISRMFKQLKRIEVMVEICSQIKVDEQ